MKKILVLALSLLPFSLQAQIVRDTVRNWEELIPLISGGQSIHVSNIHLTGPDNAFCGYHAVNGELGLTGGVFMCTGNVNAVQYFQPNSSPQAGVDNGFPGHPLLDALSGNTTYNATGIEFDFSSPVADTLQLKFMFASEEYKEYVGSQFNDVFGFYVTAGPGITAPVNIAVIPNTNTHVAINEINHITNTGYYIDNELMMAGPVEFDGLVSLTTTAFPMVADSMYHIHLLISDASDGIFDSGVFLELMSGSQSSYCGTIWYENQPAGPGMVELFGYSQALATAYFYATDTVDSSGNFNFSNLQYGAYIIRSTLDASLYPLATPMYLDSAALWTDAHIVYIPTLDSTCADFYHRELIASGPGSISGFVYEQFQDKSIFLHPGHIPANVMAVDAYGQTAGYGKVHEDGSYTLDGLEYGSYRIVPDVPLYKVMDTVWVTLSSEMESADGLSFMADAAAMEIHALTNPPADKDSRLSFSIFPNPNDGEFSIGLTGDETLRSFNVQVCDLLGRVIYQSPPVEWPHAYLVWRADLRSATLASGMYVLRIRADGVEKTAKFMVH